MLLMLVGCKDPGIPEPPKPTPEPEKPAVEKKAVAWSPTEAKADEALTITFTALKGSPLYGYEGDVYAHLGIVDGDEWLYVPATWDQNLDKCKLTKQESNVWKLELKPSVREWFGAEEDAPLTRLGIVFRSADGTKKGVAEDTFIPLKDSNIAHPETVEAALPAGCKEGLNRHSDGSVTLVLYDLNKSGKHYDHAYVIGSFTNWKRDTAYAMKRDSAKKVWWLTLSGLDPAVEHTYQYYLFGFGKNVKVADPYSRKVLWEEDSEISSEIYPNLTPYPKGKTAGAVTAFKVQEESFPWAHSEGFVAPDAKDLMIYELLVRDFTHEGSIEAVRKQLDYIQEMGFNAVELMPIQEFDGNNSWGYNPCFFYATDKAYGTEQHYKAFIDECHQRGMAVILDVVYNHATERNPWAKLYFDSATHLPTPDNPWFNVSAPHPFSVFLDFNHESPQVQQFVADNLAYLLREFKVDGFRFDLSKGFTQKASTEQNASEYDASRVANIKRYIDAVKAVKPDAYIILEHFCETKEEKELTEAGAMVWRNANHAFCQAAMGYPEQSSFMLLSTKGAGMPFGSFVGYMESHDEERMAYKQKTYGVGSIRTNPTDRRHRLEMGAAFFFLTSGPKMVWQFGELAYDISIDNGGRTGKKISYLDKQDESERAQLRERYTQLIGMRLQHSDLFGADTPFSWEVAESNWTKGRTLTVGEGSRVIRLFGNFNPDADNTFSLGTSATTWYDALTGEQLKDTKELTLAPNTFRLLCNFQVN